MGQSPVLELRLHGCSPDWLSTAGGETRHGTGGVCVRVCPVLGLQRMGSELP